MGIRTAFYFKKAFQSEQVFLPLACSIVLDKYFKVVSYHVTTSQLKVESRVKLSRVTALVGLSLSQVKKVDESIGPG